MLSTLQTSLRQLPQFTSSMQRYESSMQVVKELRRECAGKDNLGRARSSPAVAWSLQRYLIFAILCCIPGTITAALGTLQDSLRPAYSALFCRPFKPTVLSVSALLSCHDGKSLPHYKGAFTSHHHCHARIIKHRTPCTSLCFACESPLPPWHLHQAHPDATLVQTASAQYGSWRSGRRSSRRGSAG